MVDAFPTQACYRCNVERPMTAFIRRIDERYYNMCRQCVSEILTARSGWSWRAPEAHAHGFRTYLLSLPTKASERLVHAAKQRNIFLCLQGLQSSCLCAAPPIATGRRRGELLDGRVERTCEAIRSLPDVPEGLGRDSAARRKSKRDHGRPYRADQQGRLELDREYPATLLFV